MIVENISLLAEGLVLDVRPTARQRWRCPKCRRKCPKYDHSGPPRRWRHLDFGATMVFLQACIPRVRCVRHGVIVSAVPWARHDAGHTRMFDDQIAWLATQVSKTAVSELMRLAWRTVGSIIARVWADIEASHDRLDGLKRIGIDEVSYRKGHKYLTVVVNHDTGHLVWAAPGRSSATLAAFFEALGPTRCAAITHVSSDQGEWIISAVNQYCPHAIGCADAFHVVQWATGALDEVRRNEWNQARARGHTGRRGRKHPSTGTAKLLKDSRYALWKNPTNLTINQTAKLEWISKTSPRLYRAYLLKEGLRYVFTVKGEEGKQALEHWLKWARRSRLPPFIHLAKRITKIKPRIHATCDHHLSNAIVESINTRIRLITRIAFGFHTPQALIALAMLNLAGHKPPLPNR